MVVYSKLIKFILILTLLNIFFSYIHQNSDLQLLSNLNKDPLLLGENNLKNEFRTIEENSINTFNLTKDDELTLNINYKGSSSSDMIFFSVKSLNKGNFDVKFGNTQKDSNKDYFNTFFNPSNISSVSLIGYNSDITEVEVISVVNYSYSLYRVITEKDNKEIEINSNNFVKFLENDKKKIKVYINFNEEFNGEIYYGIVKLATKDTNYIPLAKNFINISNKSIINSKEIDIESTNESIDKKDNENKNFLAFIFSINDDKKIYSYKITINKFDSMNIFLIISISVAFVFAVITFFLIRRKQNIGNNNETNYNDENKEE